MACHDGRILARCGGGGTFGRYPWTTHIRARDPLWFEIRSSHPRGARQLARAGESVCLASEAWCYRRLGRSAEARPPYQAAGGAPSMRETAREQVPLTPAPYMTSSFKFCDNLPLRQTLSRATFCDTDRKDLYQCVRTARLLSKTFYNSACILTVYLALFAVEHLIFEIFAAQSVGWQAGHG